MMKCSRKSLFICLMSVSLVFNSGCNTQGDDGKNDDVTLVTPVGVSEEYEYVSYRNMYVTDVYPSSVNPMVTEYSFSKDQVFESYGAIPGEEVNAGDVLVYAQTRDLDKETENIDEKIDDLENNHAIEQTRLEKNLIDVKKDEEEALEDYEKIKRQEPEPCTIEHDMWENQIHWPEFSYLNMVQRREKTEEEYKHFVELYELEHKYMLEKRQRINDKAREATVSTNTQGEIVACNFFENGMTIPKDTPVLAVGDTSTKVLQTDYISKGTITKALDVYAIIDGKRYEIIYENMEPEEYQQLVDEEESVHTTFALEDPNNEVEIGSYAAVVVEKDRRKNVLCLPIDALKKESDSYYVYLLSEEETKYVPVEIGIKDGMYAEVLTGLSEGDKVLSANIPKLGKNTAVLEKGDYSINTEISGFLYYPFSQWLVNPAQTGTTYLKEMLVAENEKVEKDQVLATIEVIPDQIEVARLNTQISRLESRLAEMNVTKAACDAKGMVSYDLNISIAENERDTKLKRRELKKLTQYSGIIEIRAPYDGIIMQLEQIKPGDILAPDAHIVEMANDSTSYIIVKDEKNQLNYGNTAKVTVSGMKGPVTVEGKVVTVNKMSLSKKLTTDYSLIAIPAEEMEAIDGSVMTDAGMWYMNNFKVNVTVRSEKNVLMIPKAAVTLKDKSTYVTVINNDGSMERRSFIPGGSDNNYYWAVDGLSEGMKICWE